MKTINKGENKMKKKILASIAIFLCCSSLVMAKPKKTFKIPVDENGQPVDIFRVNQFNSNDAQTFRVLFKNVDRYDFITTQIALETINQILKENIYSKDDILKPNAITDYQDIHYSQFYPIYEEHKLKSKVKDITGISAKCFDKQAINKFNNLVKSGKLEEIIKKAKITEKEVKKAFRDIAEMLNTNQSILNNWIKMSKKSIEKINKTKKENIKDITEQAKSEYDLFGGIIKKYLPNIHEKITKKINAKDIKYLKKVLIDSNKEMIKSLKENSLSSPSVEIEKETFEEVDSIRTNSKDVELDYNKNVEIDDIKLPKNIIKNVQEIIKTIKIDKVIETNFNMSPYANQKEYKPQKYAMLYRALPFILNLELNSEEMASLKKTLKNLEQKLKNQKSENELYNLGVFAYNSKNKKHPLTQKEKQNRKVLENEGKKFLETLIFSIENTLKKL